MNKYSKIIVSLSLIIASIVSVLLGLRYLSKKYDRLSGLLQDMYEQLMITDELDVRVIMLLKSAGDNLIIPGEDEYGYFLDRQMQAEALLAGMKDSSGNAGDLTALCHRISREAMVSVSLMHEGRKAEAMELYEELTHGLPMVQWRAEIRSQMAARQLEIERITAKTRNYASHLNVLFFAALALVALLMFYIIFVIRVKIMKPLAMLKTGMGKIISGDFNARLGIREKDDVGELAAHFNRMLEMLMTDNLKLKYISERIENNMDIIRKVAAGNFEEYCELSGNNDIFDGLSMGINMMVEDIRSRIEEVKNSESYIRSLFDSMMNACFVLDEKRVIRDMNLAAVSLLGYSREELVGKPFHNISGNGAPLFDSTELRFGKKAFQKNVEMQYRSKDGVTIPMLVSSASVKGLRNEKESIICVAQDITEIKQTEKVMKASEARYRVLLEGSADGILVADIETRKFKYANKAFLIMFGYSQEVIETMGVEELHPVEALPRVISVFEAQIRGDISLAEEIPCLKSDGKVLFADINTAPMVLDGRQCNVGFFRDVSERMRLREERNRLEAQLRHSQKMEAVGTLVGGIAHDFNNLLTTIMGYSMLLVKSVKDTESNLYKDLKEIQTASERAAALVSQLLTFSRKSEVHLETIDINTVLENVEKMVCRTIGEHIQTECSKNKALWKVKADKGNIEQILMNLVINARDAMEGGGTISVSTDNVQIETRPANAWGNFVPGKYAVLEIRDTGTGIQSDHLDRIFDPFFTTKPVGKGTGLGLSIVYSIVQSHNGWLSVDTGPGKGTCFKVAFPAVVVSEIYRAPVHDAGLPQPPPPPAFTVISAASEVESRPLPSAMLGQRGDGELILVVEDEEGVRNLMEKILSEAGYRVLTAAGIEAAYKLLESKRNQPDVAICDVVLPDGNGLELAEMLIEKSGIRIIMCSGYTDEQARLETIKAMGIPFFRKPFELEELLSTVKRLCGRKQAPKRPGASRWL